MKKIDDSFSHILSRQRRYQLRKINMGCCSNCGCKNTGPWKDHCPECTLKKRKLMQKKIGVKPWKPGGKGRIPFEAL